jgi:hypothetical protein
VVEIGSGPSPSPLPIANANLLGAASTGGVLFAGSLDEVAIYDSPLATLRIQAHYAAAQ